MNIYIYTYIYIYNDVSVSAAHFHSESMVAWRGHGRSRRLIAPICGGGVHLVPPPWPCGYVHDLGAADEAWIMLGRIFVGVSINGGIQ